MSLVILAPAAAVVGLLAYLLGYAIYELVFSPLSKIPGPKIWAVSYIPYVRLYTSGHAHRMILKLHQQYGPVVRVGPTHVSIHHPDAHESVKSNHKSEENPKDPLHNANNRLNIMGSTRVDHQRYRRVLAHGFSAQTMLDQQPIIRGYVDKLIQRLHEASKTNNGPIDLEKWFNFTTFDIIGDLTFGEPFGCLEDGTYHPWIDIMFKSVKNMSFLTATSRLSWLAPLFRKTIPKNVASKLAENQALTREKVKKRMELGTARPDFMDSMIRKSETAGSAMSFPELTSNAFALITAGSETTATALTATTYFLATNPDCLKKLTAEVLSTFSSESEIDLLSVQKLPYMTAILTESMRLYPPAPGSQPRMAKQGGTEILGYFIPEGTTIDTWQWALYHNPEHFSRVEEFIPERWLGDPRFDNDAKKVVQPFSIGYRNCIGKNLANAEMRLVLSRLIWNFEIRAAEGIHKFYEESEVHLLWQKGPMKVYLTPRTR
ncbi:cytochrome P450 [Colletotrichum zoysiae]|uniref:Cytochrome P450 n=1 Tax=Colletotrichum zoysiae TaxID=1216348 RepID=A0AAD9LVK5_9PEZI|nr:cytochrome P450 [Colletotrichum zoysiae]